MPHAQLARLTRRLAELKASSLYRSRRLLESPQGVKIKLDGKDVTSFCSNDYLGLASDPELIRVAEDATTRLGMGAGASHLITGHHRVHEEFEQAFAEFVGMPASLLFSTGYMANLGVITSLVGRRGEVFADKLNHASLNDAALLSGGTFTRYAHADVGSLRKLLEKTTAQEKLIATDSVFSMDGDLAPADALLDLAEEFDAWLYLDDAHGFGVLGHGGKGMLDDRLRASDRVIYLATLGKAAGVFGAAVAAHEMVIDWLVNRAHTYIYTTALPPFMAVTLNRSLELIKDGEVRRERLKRHIQKLKAGLSGLTRWKLMESETPIQPLVVGGNEMAVDISNQLLERGMLVPAIRTPTVPKGTARLRITLSAAHEDADVEGLISALQELSRA
jgi:8-amino-7-oxononanoate synthase